MWLQPNRTEEKRDQRRVVTCFPSNLHRIQEELGMEWQGHMCNRAMLAPLGPWPLQPPDPPMAPSLGLGVAIDRVMECETGHPNIQKMRIIESSGEFAKFVAAKFAPKIMGLQKV